MDFGRLVKGQPLQFLQPIILILSALLLTSVAVRADQPGVREGQEFAKLTEEFRKDALGKDRIAPDVVQRMHDVYRQTGDIPEDLRRMASLVLGVHYLTTDHERALQYLTSAEMLTPKGHQLAPIVKYYQTSALLLGGAFAQAARDALALMKQDLGKSWEESLYLLATEAMAKANMHQEIVAVYERYERKVPAAKRAELVMRRAVAAYEKLGKIERVAEVLEDLAGNYPVTDLSRWAFRYMQEIRCRPEGKNLHYSKNFLLTLARNATLDIGTEEFIVAAISEPIRLNRNKVVKLQDQEKLDFLFQARLYDEALTFAQQLYIRESRRERSQTLADIQIMMGRINFRLRDYEQSARYFAEYLSRFPNSSNLASVREFLADTYKRLDAYRLAADHYATVAGRTRDRELRWAHFWNLYRNREYQKALNVLDVPKYIAGRSRSDGDEVLYWRARLLEKLDRQAEAMVLYTRLLTQHGGGFYAQLIASRYPELVDERPQAKLVTVSNHAATSFRLAARLLDSKESEEQNFSWTPELRSIRDLLDVGMRQTAHNQLSKLQWNDYDEEHLFASAGFLALALGDYQPSRRLKYRVFSALRDLPDSWWDLRDHKEAHPQEWRIYYPQAYEKQVRDVSQRVKIDPYFLMSIMRAESYYNSDARSPVGAQGLMQIMPYTGARIAKLINDDNFQASDLSIPGVSIVYGGYYMKKLVDYYQGNLMLATAAYNAGPDAVNRWIKFCDGCDVDEFIESIPYRETRRYVMKVMQNLATYHQVYEGAMTFPAIPELPKTLPENEIIF